MTRAETLLQRYGADYFKKLGAKGGKNTPIEKRGFSNPEVAKRAGKKSRPKPGTKPVGNRITVNRPQPKGQDNARWKGEEASYNAKHIYIHRTYGKASKCEECRGEGLQYQWSNISGDYIRERSDWQELCTKCHGAYDAEQRKLKKVLEKNITLAYNEDIKQG